MTTDNNVLIRVENLQKSFGSLKVLDGIDIDKSKFFNSKHARYVWECDETHNICRYSQKDLVCYVALD